MSTNQTPSQYFLTMNKELQIKSTLLDIENKTDKNGHPYFRLSLFGMPTRYFYAFSFSLPPATLTALNTPQNFINRQVLITYQELTNQNGGNGTFFKVKEIQVM
jgi:hypothetical protein